MKSLKKKKKKKKKYRDKQKTVTTPDNPHSCSSGKVEGRAALVSLRHGSLHFLQASSEVLCNGFLTGLHQATDGPCGETCESKYAQMKTKHVPLPSRLILQLGRCRPSKARQCNPQSKILPLWGGWTWPLVGQMASPQPEGDLRGHTSNPFSYLTFSLQLHRIWNSLLDWHSFNGHLIKFWMFIVPLLQHLPHLPIPVMHLTSNVWRCPTRIEASVSGALISSSSQPSPHLISPVVRGSSPPLLINNNNDASSMLSQWMKV